MEVLPFLKKHGRIYLLYTALGLLLVLAFATMQKIMVYPQAQARHFIVPTILGLMIGMMFSTLVALRREVQSSKLIFRAVADMAQEFVYVQRVDGVYEYVSPSCFEITGYHQADFFAHPKLMDELVMPDDRALWEGHVHRMHDHGRPERLRVRIRSRDGKVHWIEHLCSDVRDAGGNIIGVRSTNMDITEGVEQEIQQAVAATAFETHEGIIITDSAERILRVNRAFSKITGYEPAEVIGMTPELLHSGRHDLEFYKQMHEMLERDGHWEGELWDRRKNGEIYPCRATITVVRNADAVVTNYVGVFSDISQRKQAEAEIYRLAYYDPLTLLPNRRLLMDRLQQTMSSSERNGTFGALLFIDLDNFKELNDTQGHDAGDKLLVEVAHRLAGSVRVGDTVSRLGGDEFVVMLANLSESDADVVNQVESVANKILSSLNLPYLLEAEHYHGSASIGVTIFRGRETTAEELLRHSDVALYQAKNSGRARLRFFDPSMQETLERRANMKADLRVALKEAQFVLHFQPQVDAKGQCTGAEALMRWQHPERGLVGPGDFIPFAEENGMILQLDRWGLAACCRQIRDWTREGLFMGLRLSVNVSAQGFMRPDFVAETLAAIYAHGIEPNRLKLEITETSLLGNLIEAIDRMEQLGKAGIAFALDDFGTGYSSLSYLRQLPIDQLKIDRAFVRNINIEQGDAVIARSIISMAQDLGLEVVAEGVETQEQFSMLNSFGCSTFQGYLFARPMAVAGFEVWLRTTSAASGQDFQ